MANHLRCAIYTVYVREDAGFIDAKDFVLKEADRFLNANSDFSYELKAQIRSAAYSSMTTKEFWGKVRNLGV